MIAFTVQPMLTPPEKNVDVNGIFEMTEENKTIHVLELPNAL